MQGTPMDIIIPNTKRSSTDQTAKFSNDTKTKDVSLGSGIKGPIQPTKYSELSFIDLKNNPKSPIYSFMSNALGNSDANRQETMRQDILTSLKTPSLLHNIGQSSIFAGHMSQLIFDSLKKSNSQFSNFRDSLKQMNTGMSNLKSTKEISDFSILESTPKEEQPTVLKKRKRGRPRKDPSLKKKKKEPTAELRPFYSSIKNSRSTVIKTQIGAEFMSDSENNDCLAVEIDLEKIKDSLKQEKLTFGEMGQVVVQDKEEVDKDNKLFHRLHLSKLLKAIEDEENRINVKAFICRFCGKSFEKPSSLGGHTAKKHNGLSQKYKKRLDAAKHRKTERDRNNFIKKRLVEDLKQD